ncbi:MAG TPA: LUD domain-containing protein [Syntrophomonadaceae bacterium]|nr:LUD domain-containing protein [Syntrophomonadaceae bacterium]
MSSRSLILENLRSSAPQTKSESIVAPFTIGPGAVDLFEEKATAAGAKVLIVDGLPAAQDKIKEILAEVAGDIIYSGDEFLKELQLKDIIDTSNRTASEVHLENSADYRKIVFAAAIGITSCHYAIAESGSVVIEHQHNNERLVSLAPETYICILREEQILENRYMMAQIIEEKAKLPSAFTLITGVSRTADVALQVVLGMHGPKNVYLIVCKNI